MDRKTLLKIDEFVEKNKNDIVNDLFTLCRIPSVRGESEKGAPFGVYTRDALYAACEIAGKYGLKTEVHAERGYAEASFGEGERTIAVLGHVDVVPPGGDWTVTEPFEPLLKDGWLYGRGVTDDKNGVITGIYVLRAAKELKLPFRSRLLSLFGCCEETGMEDIENYTRDKKTPDFCMVADANFPACFCEKDITDVKIEAELPFKEIISLSGGVAANAVAASADAVLPNNPKLRKELVSICSSNERLSVKEGKKELVLTAKGITAHASTPENSINALSVLFGALTKCGALCGGDRKITGAAQKAVKDHYGKGLYIDGRDKETGDLTCVCGLAFTEEKKLVLNFNIRYARASSAEKVKTGIKAFCAENGFKITGFNEGKGYYNEPSNEKISGLMRAYREITGEKNARPYCMGGGTYARHIKNAVAFGLNFDEKAPGLAQGHGKEHEPDESISLESFLKGIKIYIAAALEADKITG